MRHADRATGGDLREALEELEGDAVSPSSRGAVGERRLLYNGKFLLDWQTLAFYRVGEGHTLLIVPAGAPAGAPAPRAGGLGRGLGGRLFATLGAAPAGGARGGGNAGGGNAARAVARGRYPFTPLSGGDGGGLPTSAVGGGAAAAALGGADGAGGILGEPAPAGDAQDLGMGVLVGFLLGFVAMICLVEGSVSQRMRLGICIGVSLQLAATALRVLQAQGAGGQQAGLAGVF